MLYLGCGQILIVGHRAVAEVDAIFIAADARGERRIAAADATGNVGVVAAKDTAHLSQIYHGVGKVADSAVTRPSSLGVEGGAL